MPVATLDPAHLFRRVRSLATHRAQSLPVVVIAPHSACNCRCTMCDIWRGNADLRQLDRAAWRPLLESLERLDARRVVLTGGEALLHPALGDLGDALAGRGLGVTLLSSGLLLEAHAASIARWCDDVVVSLDGPADVHDRIRGVPGGHAKMAAGIAALREAGPGLAVSGRCVVQRANLRHLPDTVDAARALGLDRISFLAVDDSTTAFARTPPWDAARADEVLPDADEARELADRIEALIRDRTDDLASGFVVEDAGRLRDLGRHFLARRGLGPRPRRRCNAPWVSAVVEADGTVRPCFFHEPLGRLADDPLDALVRSESAVAFRRRLDVATDPVCRDCVCTLSLAPWAAV